MKVIVFLAFFSFSNAGLQSREMSEASIVDQARASCPLWFLVMDAKHIGLEARFMQKIHINNIPLASVIEEM